MKHRTVKKGNSGFTMVEMLAASAIVAILLAVGIVAVVYYARWLRITELDNTAREIYLAAENRAVLLWNSGKMGDLTPGEGGSADPDKLMHPLNLSGLPGADDGMPGGDDVSGAEEAPGTYYISYRDSGKDSALLAELLPREAIDPELWNGFFYVVYEPESGSVTDVFYAEDDELLEDADKFGAFYMQWRNTSRAKRLDEKKMIGYYGGGAAENKTASALGSPMLIVTNGEELKIQLIYEAPLGETGIVPEVKLSYEGAELVLTGPGCALWMEKSEASADGVTVHTYTWVLDTLKPGGPRFAELFNGVTENKPASFGRDFTATARLYQGEVSSPLKTATGNSLFANGSGETVAYIENLRHLQNLDEQSKVAAEKTAAVQIADIDCGTSMYAPYEFVPIENGSLKSYCGSYEKTGETYVIKGLTVTEDSAQGRSAAGLFSTVSSAAAPWEFKDIRLVNATVTTAAKPVGALVGTASNASFTNCWVYWEEDAQTVLSNLVIEDESGDSDSVKYQIVGTIAAGGLAGELQDSTVENCLAATLVQGYTAGGLLGVAGNVVVRHSYADCYLKGNTTAGLVGSGAGITLHDVYSAGFINLEKNEKKYAAGLCSDAVTAENAYSAMNYGEVEGNYVTPLAMGMTDSEGAIIAGVNCHYLYVNALQHGETYKNMVDKDFVETMGKEKFEQKGLDQSYPYNLLVKGLMVYSLPGLKDLPHYGDWNTEFVKPALVYFEQYKKGDEVEYGFSGGNVEVLKSYNEIQKGGWIIPLDGYAVALLGDDVNNVSGDSGEFKVEYTYQTGPNGSAKVTETYQIDNLYTVERGGKTYYLAPLPDDLITSEYAAKDFYQYISFAINEAQESTLSAYSPHFARTAVGQPEGMEEGIFKTSMSNANVRAHLRTPRHLRMLSEHTEYSYGQTKRIYSFYQDLDLDYTQYTAYEWDPKAPQKPIGEDTGKPFNGVYNGYCRSIKGVALDFPQEEKGSNAGAGGKQMYAGLFGYSSGTLRNIVFLMDAESTLYTSGDNHARLYVGGLAGSSSGVIDNCAVAGVNLDARGYNSTRTYIGGLVGQNSGMINRCAAESAKLYTNSDVFAEAFCGGLVGENGYRCTITSSYAVGYITADVDSMSKAKVCGFVGQNYGRISGCYAAADLRSSGEDVETHGFCGEENGTQVNTFFLNRGNFSYRGSAYNASYADVGIKAQAVSYKALTDRSEPKIAPLLAAGMGLDAKTVVYDDGTLAGGAYPYPAAVKDANGALVHYGQWPDRLELGEMGVYYWEKLEVGGAAGYYVSLLAVDSVKETIKKQSTLSTAHSDGGVVTDYGYGYYEIEGKAVTASTDDILYTEDGTEGIALEGLANKSDTTVNEGLAKLMPGYTFYSYHTFVPNPEPGKTGVIRGGVYPSPADGKPNGTLTLGQAGVEVSFELNPHFADALAAKLPAGWKPSAGEVAKSPGADETNPYEVRAVGQLSAINWNRVKRDTKTVMVGLNMAASEVTERESIYRRNTDQFPYLSYITTDGRFERDYCWKQTHDISGNNGIYTPICEYYAVWEFENLVGWFGGTFDGDDYVIENVNIQGQTSTVAGLFGAVYNGTLKNIILYSSDGEGFVTSSFDTNKMISRAYYMGTLAGLAATSDANKNAVENCSSSGYTVYLKTYNTKDSYLGQQDAGGSGVGGLLGASNMNLKNCSAVNTIRIISNSGNFHGNDNIRAGGLVGIAQKTIENCYAGGEITVGGLLDENGIYSPEGIVRVKAQNGLFLGGIVGGSYFKELTVTSEEKVGDAGQNGGGSGNVLKNCYSYVVLPSQNDTRLESTKSMNSESVEETKIRGLYALGGVGDHSGVSSTITNCYYLESTVMRNNPEGFDTTTKFKGGSEDSGDRKEFTLKTDIVPMETSAWIIGEDNTEDEIKLTPKDVGETFTIDLETYRIQYTRNLSYAGHTENNQICRYYKTTNTPTPGMPIFVVGSGSSNVTKGTAPAVFKGWVKSFGTPTAVVTTVEPQPLTYAQLSGAQNIYKGETERSIYQLLGDFSRVTTMENGFSVAGKYSYAPARFRNLQGLNYPFPTILTRSGGSINVHYGSWPLNGIVRSEGARPIELNLFNKPMDPDVLTLSDGVPLGGEWTVTSADERIAKAEITPVGDKNEKGELRVTGVSRGLTNVTVTYTVGGESYSIVVSVNVTVKLRLEPASMPVYLFTGDTAKVPVYPCGEYGEKLDEDHLEKLKVNLAGSSVIVGDQAPINGSLMWDEENSCYYLELKSVEKLAEEMNPQGIMVIKASYEYDGVKYEDDTSIEFQVVEPEVDEASGTVTFALSESETAKLPVVKVISAEAVPEPGEAETPTEPETPEEAGEPEPSGEKVIWGEENGLEANQLRPEGFAPGTTVTVKAVLEVTGDDPQADKAQTHEVLVTVTIPEETENTSAAADILKQNIVAAIEPDPMPGTGIADAAQDGEMGIADAAQDGGMEMALAAAGEPEQAPAPLPRDSRKLTLDAEPEPGPILEPDAAVETDPEEDASAAPEPGEEPNQDPEPDAEPESSEESQAEEAGQEDGQEARTELRQKLRLRTASRRCLSVERRALHGRSLEKAAQSERGVYFTRLTVLSAMRNGRGVGADGGGVQRGEDRKQPEGAAEVFYAVIGAAAGVR